MRRARRGALLIVALVALGVAAMIALAMLQAVAAGRNELRTEAWRIQAGWLAESALDRAAARLAHQADYPGETWIVPGNDAGVENGAVVRIRVEPLAGQPARRRIHVEADYPDHPHRRVRESREAVIGLPLNRPPRGDQR